MLGKKLWLVLSLSILYLFVYFPTLAAIEEVKFRFNPPDKTGFVQTIKLTKITDLGELGRMTDTGQMVDRVVIRRTARGFQVRRTAQSAALFRNGKPAPDPVLSAMKGLTITYDLDKSGKITAIRGHEQVMKRLKKNVGSKFAKTLQKMLSKKELDDRARAEWEDRIGGFIGREAKIGEVWLTKERYPLSSGKSIIVHSATKVVGQIKKPHRSYVEIRFAADSDPEGLAAFTGKAKQSPQGRASAGELPARAGRPKQPSTPDAKLTSISDSGERLMDPVTMLIYGEKVTQKVRMPIEAPGRGRVMVMTEETKEYTYRYDK